MSDKKLSCPHCHNEKKVFLRSAIEEPTRVFVVKDEDGDIRDEDIGMCITEYTYTCAKCKKIITEGNFEDA